MNIVAVMALLLACPVDSPDPPTEIVAFIWHDSPNDQKALVGLKRGLVALGLAADLKVVDVDGDESRAKAVLKEASGSARMVIAFGTKAALLAKQHVKGIPVVFTAVTNPVLSGIVASWDGSGTNLCGNSNWLDRREMLEAFRLAVPDLRRLCVLTSRGNAVSRAEVLEASAALSGTPGFELIHRELEDIGKLSQVLGEVVGKADAIWLPIDYQLYQEGPLRQIMSAAEKAKKPVVSSTERSAGRGALVVVTVDYEALGLRAASLVKRIVRAGEEPGRMPVGKMSAARIYVDLAAARKIGAEVPLDLVLKAYRVFAVDGRER